MSDENKKVTEEAEETSEAAGTEAEESFETEAETSETETEADKAGENEESESDESAEAEDGDTDEAGAEADETEASEEAEEETASETAAADTAEETTGDSKASKKKKGKEKPVNSSGEIITKKKGRLSATAKIAIIVAAAMVAAIVVYFGIHYDWYHMVFPIQDSMTMGDYTTIEVHKDVMDSVDDDLVQDSIDDMLAEYEETNTITEGTVEEGDEICISYVGTIDGEEFDGGSADDETITVGESGYIDGFDDGLIGAEIGDTIELDLTFPDDYDDEDLAGQDVTFTVTIEYLTEVITPDLDDDFVAEYSEEYWGDQIDTVDDLYDYVYDYLYTYYLHSEMLEYLQEQQTIESYGQENFDLLYEYTYEELSYYASYYGMDVDTLAYYYGYDDADTYATEEAIYYDELIMLFDYLWEDLGLEDYTEEDVDAGLEEYMEENGYTDIYTLDEFKDASGDGWLLIYEGIQFRYDTVMEALEDRVVLVEDEDEDEDEDTDEESEDEDADDEEETESTDTDEDETEEETESTDTDEDETEEE